MTSAAFVAFVFVVVFIATGAQSITGFGFALIVVPAVAIVEGPKEAAVLMTAIGVPMTLWNTIRWRADLQRREALLVSAGALVGMPVGAYVLTHANDQTLRFLIGAVTLIMTFALWRGLTFHTGRGALVTAGAISGGLATSVGTNGPPIVITFQAAGMAAKPFRATLAACFFVQGSVALAVFWANDLVTSDLVPAWAVAVPAVLLGGHAGDRIAAHTDRRLFRPAVLVLLALSGVAAVIAALAG